MAETKQVIKISVEDPELLANTAALYDQACDRGEMTEVEAYEDLSALVQGMLRIE